MFVIQKQLVCTDRVARRPADAADLETRQARDRRDDRGQRSNSEERCGEGAEECDGAEEPPRGVLARLWRWDRVGLLFDGLGRVHEELYEDVRGDRGADAIAALEYDDLIAALHVCIVDVAAMEDIMVIAISSVVADGFMRKPRSGPRPS